MQPVWKEIGLIGRDKLLRNQILPMILHPTQRFVIDGDAGSGKSAILEWAMEHSEAKCALISGSVPYTTSIKMIAESWELDCGDKPKQSDYETAILQNQGNLLLIDDMQKLQPKMLTFLKAVSDRHKLCGAIRPGVRKKEDLRQLLWGFKTIKLKRLDNADTERMAQESCLKYGSPLKFRDVANNSNGLPGKIMSMVHSGQIQRYDTMMISENIDIGPWIIGALAFMAILRVFGRALDSTDLMLVGTAVLLVVRIFLYPFLTSARQK